MPEILNTKPDNWTYVSEGGATIVFSFTGSSNPDFNGTALRLRKISVAKPSIEARLQESDELDDLSIEYQAKCMKRLLPPAYLPRLQAVHLNRCWLEQLVELHNRLRPEDRRSKDEVDLERRLGVLATDLVGGNWLAVEIKPKWAFLPSPVHLSSHTRAVKTSTCRFCMHSHLKTQKSRKAVTNYCPLDLFSGDEERMRRAIRNLWDAWVESDATANNLKIFARGKFLKPSETHKMLLDSQAAGLESHVLRDAFVDSVLQPLLHTPLLRILSDLQRDLDALDIEGLFKLWRSSKFAQFPEPNISDWIEFSDNYTRLDKPRLDHSDPSPDNLRYYMLAYLLSATLKDCSLIVKLDFLQLSAQPQMNIRPASLTVIDLDPKSINKLRDWEELDREIACAYASSQRKTCIDAWQAPKLFDQVQPYNSESS